MCCENRRLGPAGSFLGWGRGRVASGMTVSGGGAPAAAPCPELSRSRSCSQLGPWGGAGGLALSTHSAQSMRPRPRAFFIASAFSVLGHHTCLQLCWEGDPDSVQNKAL